MKRFLHIDFLRAVSIIAVIAIHVFSDNLTNQFRLFVWNYLHFVIVAFVFCSGYVMYKAYAPKLHTFFDILKWYKKRLFRLVLPFYWYLLFHYALIWFFPQLFSGLGLKFSWSFLFQSITLTGGANLNWLPLLFLQLGVLFPFLVLSFEKRRKLFLGYVAFAAALTLSFTIWLFPYSHYREVMWIPWSLFLVLPWYFYKKEEKKFSFLPYLLFSLAGAVGFVLLYIVWVHTGRSLTLIDNKYPPNLFYLSYGIFGSFLMLGISLWNIFKIPWVAAFYQFVSKTSYSLFFIHYIVMDAVLSLRTKIPGGIPIVVQLVVVIGGSIGIAWVLVAVQKIAKRFAASLFWKK